MRQAFRFLLISLVAVMFAVNCAPKKNENRPSGGDSDKDGLPGRYVNRLPERLAPKTGAIRKNVLEGASVSVLGLKLPQGMVPISGAHKIYRFEGIQPVEQTADFIRAQIDRPRETKEENGYLFLAVKLVDPKPKSASINDQRLGIRVSKKPGAKTTVAVWIDDNAGFGKQLRNSPYESSRPSAGSSRAFLNSSQRTRRENARQETLRVWNKIAHGEELTEEDLKSPYFE